MEVKLTTKNNKRILIVDDEEMIIEILVEMINSNSFLNKPIIDTASDGQKALPLIESNKYDLIITDFMMPNLNGFKLIESVRTKYINNKSTPIVCLSGYLVKFDTTVEAHLLEDVMFVEKPFETDKINRMLKLFLL